MLAWRFGWARGHDFFDKIGQGFGFAAASLMVGYGGILILMAWLKNLRVLAVAFGFVWVISFAAETASHVGVLATNNAQTHNSAVMSKARYEASVNGLKVAEADVKRLQGEVAKEPALSADAAQGEIDRSKSHRFWTVTNGCAETKGPQTREFCARFFAARAALGEHEKRSAKLADLQAAQERLAKAREGAASVTVNVAASDAQSLALAKLLTLSLKPGEDASEATNIAAVLLLALFFVSLGMANTGLWYLTHGSDAASPAAQSSVPNHSVGPANPAAPPSSVAARDSMAVKTFASLIGGQPAPIQIRPHRVATAA
ncbi:MAG: hypothetical protein E6Q97_31300 [Desulfurellales bacterium]|nr:MAG: hypothetical protein E6Q97_31300 [Desulfurellales bacterium]